MGWQAGVYYLNLEREVGVASVPDPGENYIAGARVQRALIGPQTEALVYDRFDTEVFAVFGQLAYEVTDDFEISAALRYDVEKRKVHSLVPSPAQQTSNFIDYTDTFIVFPLGLFPCPGLGDGPGSPLNPAAKRVYSAITMAPTIHEPITILTAWIFEIGALAADATERSRNAFQPPA